MILLQLFEPWQNYFLFGFWRPIQRWRCYVWGLVVFTCEKTTTSAWPKYLRLCKLVSLCVSFCNSPVPTLGSTVFQGAQKSKRVDFSKGLPQKGRDLEIELFMGHGKGEKNPERTETVSVFQTRIFFRVSLQPLFCWIPSSMQSTTAPVTSSVSQWMTLVPLLRGCC